MIIGDDFIKSEKVPVKVERYIAVSDTECIGCEFCDGIEGHYLKVLIRKSTRIGNKIYISRIIGSPKLMPKEVKITNYFTEDEMSSLAEILFNRKNEEYLPPPTRLTVKTIKDEIKREEK